MVQYRATLLSGCPYQPRPWTFVSSASSPIPRSAGAWPGPGRSHCWVDPRLRGRPLQAIPKASSGGKFTRLQHSGAFA